MVNEIIPKQMASDEQDSLMAAANSWRLPYWDWAVHNEVPLLAQDELVEVTTKFGTIKIKNPLYQYDLPKGKTFGTMGPPSNQTYTLISADGVPASISNAKTGHLTNIVDSGNFRLLLEDAPQISVKILPLFKQASSTTLK